MRRAAIVRTLAMTLVIACLAACGKRDEAPLKLPVPAPKDAPQQQTPPPPSLTAPPAAAPAPTPVPPAAAPDPKPPAPPPIGTIDSLEGDVRLVRAGAQRTAAAGAALEPGDTLIAGPQSWALLAMVDGATMTVRPDTEMRIDAYRYVPDGNPGDNTSSWSLVKGALRSITGLIGKRNPPGYQVKTPTATIGIRGTDHEPAYYPEPAAGEKADHPPGTYDKVNAGESVIRSPGGTVPVRRGQTAFARAEARAKPQILAKPPAFYQRQAEVDRRAAPRRQQFHREYDDERRKEVQLQRVQQQEAARKAQDERRAKQADAQKSRLDERKQQQDARKGEQEKRRSEQDARKAEQQKRNAEKKDPAKARSDSKAEPKKGDEKKGRDRPQADKAAPLPPGVADRVKGMQRGDKAVAPPGRSNEAPRPPTQRAQPERAQPERAQPQRAQPQQRSQQEPSERRPPRAQQEAQGREAPQQERRQQQRLERDSRKGDQPGR